MDRQAYICANDVGKNYYYMFSILDFDDIPIVFVAKDDSDHIYLCDCVEFRNSQKWIIVKTDYVILMKIVTKQISVYDALLTEDELVDFVVYDYDNETFQHNVSVRMEALSPEELPDKNSMLHYPNPEAINKTKILTTKNT